METFILAAVLLAYAGLYIDYAAQRKELRRLQSCDCVEPEE